MDSFEGHWSLGESRLQFFRPERVILCRNPALNARDKYHFHVRKALEKEGWTITHDPYKFKYLSSKKQEIDLGAERSVIAAEKGTEKIAVEIKSFLDDSVLHDLYEAFGQYLVYLNGLEEIEPERTLFLAMPEGVLKRDIDLLALQKFIKRYQMKIMVFNVLEETITEVIQ